MSRKYRDTNYDPKATPTPTEIGSKGAHQSYDDLRAAIAELDAILPSLQAHANDQYVGDYYQKQIDEVVAQREEYATLASRVVGSWRWVEEEFASDQIARRADERELQARRAARHEAKQAEREQHDAAIAKYEWSLVPNADNLTIEQKRAIAAPYARAVAEVKAANAEIDNVLAHPDLIEQGIRAQGVPGAKLTEVTATVKASLESSRKPAPAEIRTTGRDGKKYVIWNDGKGVVVEPDVAANMGGGDEG